MPKKMFFRAQAEKGIPRHIDIRSVIWTLINNNKLANQIARLAAIVVCKNINLHGCTEKFFFYFLFAQYILQAKFSNTVSLEKKKEACASVLDAINAVNAGEKKTLEQVY